jgi:hypothetical protein
LGEEGRKILEKKEGHRIHRGRNTEVTENRKRKRKKEFREERSTLTQSPQR